MISNERRRCSIVDSRCSGRSRSNESTRFYVDVLGFKRDPIDADGEFLVADNFKVMLGGAPTRSRPPNWAPSFSNLS
jgi:hypothetical protein